MNSLAKLLGITLCGMLATGRVVLAQTDGAARMAVTLNDYNGSSKNHWTVVWVTTEAGQFIATLWKQGTKYAFNSSQWTTHCPQWNAARGGVNGYTFVDGYTSATATSYAGTNSPVILTWDCRDTNNVLVADGNYKFWVQYAEDSGAGPYTTNGLRWTKGPAPGTNNYANLGPNFTSMQVRWTPAAVAPIITSAPPPASGTVGVPYNHVATATGTAPVTFTASGLPAGLSISPAGVISGVPRGAGTFTGAITAANGTLPAANQNFSITVGVVPVRITSSILQGNSLVFSGSGPAQGIYAVLSTATPDLPLDLWPAVATNTFNAEGSFEFSIPLAPGTPGNFYRLRVP